MWTQWIQQTNETKIDPLKYCSSWSFESPEGMTVGRPDNTVSFSKSSESPQRLFEPQRLLHFFFCDESELSSYASSTEMLHITRTKLSMNWNYHTN